MYVEFFSKSRVKVLLNCEKSHTSRKTMSRIFSVTLLTAGRSIEGKEKDRVSAPMLTKKMER